MSNRLNGKRIIFIGAATGIGCETVKMFADEGAQLVVVDNNAGAGSETAKSVGAAFVHCDISDEASVKAMVALASGKLGGVDVLVNNAAIQFSGAVTEFSVEQWDKIYSVNVRGMFLACKHVVPELRKSPAAAIVNTASLAGLRGIGGMSAYSSTKGAVIALTSALALELGPDRIRVNAICPGWVDTPFNNPAIDYIGGVKVREYLLATYVPLGRQAVSSEIAPLFVYLASDESKFMTAQSIVIDGGAYN